MLWLAHFLLFGCLLNVRIRRLEFWGFQQILSVLSTIKLNTIILL